MTFRALSALEQWQDSIQADLQQLEVGNLRRYRRAFELLPDGILLSDGQRLVNLSGNDYLGLSYEPRVIAAATKAMESTVGARASALVSGRSHWHTRLEKTIAEFEGCEDALVFPTGVAANVGVLTALIDENDIVYCDRLNHASLVDGCRQSGGRFRIYHHHDLSSLKRQLMQPFDGGRRWIVTDGVFSMDGDIAPLRELCELAEAYDALVVVDEAHGTGVFGERGRGVCEFLDVEDRVALKIGTLSKAIGALGGFVTGRRVLCEYLLNHARTQIYSTALPPAICAAATTAIEIIGQEPERRQWLWQRVDFVRERMNSLGLLSEKSFRSPILSLVLGEPAHVMDVARQLEAEGFLVAAIRPPTVPRGTSRLRLSLHSELSISDLEQLSQVLARILSNGSEGVN